MSFADADDLTVGVVGSTIGITTGNPGPGGTVTITASGFLTVDQTIDTSAGTGGVLTATGVVFHTVPVLGAGDIVLSGLNHAPALDLDDDDSAGQSGGDFANSWTENGGPVAVADADATLVDVDNANLQSLTITITNLLDGAAESLAADTSGTSVTASYNSGTGVLTLSGVDTPAHYQQVLRTVTYDNSSEAPTPAARTITFVASDGVASSNVGTTTLGMTATNDAPVLAAIEGTSLAYTENDPATAITALLTASDVDDTHLTEATIQITGNYQDGQDVLSFTDTGTITGNWNAATGTLTLSGSDTVANYEAALRAVKYTNTSETPSAGAHGELHGERWHGQQQHGHASDCGRAGQRRAATGQQWRIFPEHDHRRPDFQRGQSGG